MITRGGFMKRVLSSLVSLLFLACLFVLPAGASGINLVKKECPECGLSSFPSKSEQVGMFVVYTFECENGHTYTYKFIPGVTDKGGTTRGGGAGRQDPPSGYTSDGVPSVNNAGVLTWQPTFPDDGDSLFLIDCRRDDNYTLSQFSSGHGKATFSASGGHASLTLNPSSGKSSFKLQSLFFYFSVKAPVSGYYSSSSLLYSLVDGIGASSSNSYYSYSHVYYDAGSLIKMPVPSSEFYKILGYSQTSNRSYLHFDLYTPRFIITPNESIITKQINITINNNSWSGNIYQDTTNNLTYIYPQYTTINENNETVTNISENPIIYNSETNQYYTYDSVTNNYYYITYEQPSTPSPAPSTSPDPGASPTPTPAPGGDSGSTSGLMDLLQSIKDSIVQGFSDLTVNFKLAIENLTINIQNIFNKKFPDISTGETAATPSPSPSASPEPSSSPSPSPDASPTPSPSVSPTPEPTEKPSKTTNFWTFIFGSGSDDGTDNGHKGILWALISLILAIISLLTGLGASTKYLFPFLPDGVITTIHICVIVLFLFAVIKFIRSFL